MENLFFTLLGAIVGWIPSALLWARDKFTSTGAPGITFVVRPHDRPATGGTGLARARGKDSQSTRVTKETLKFRDGAPARLLRARSGLEKVRETLSKS